MKGISICILLVMFFACKQDEKSPKILDFGLFKITTPGGWTKIKRQGVDSYVGGLTNNEDTLWFDYGWYGVNLGQSLYPNKFALDTVNGLVAEISIPKDSTKGFYSLFISKVNQKDRFSLYGENISNKNMILKIFKSLVFKESDTSKNPPLIDEKFSKTLKASGEMLFRSNCANCHKIDADYSGPALHERLSVRDKEWVYLFLTHRDQIKNDSMRDSLNKEYQFKCLNYPDLSRDEVNAIYNYCN